MTVNKCSGAESRETECAVCVQAKRLLYNCIEPWEVFERVAIHVEVIGEASADLLLELFEFGGVCEQEVDASRKEVGVRVESSNDEMVGLGEKKIFRWLLFIVDQLRKVVRVCELVPAFYPAPDDVSILS